MTRVRFAYSIFPIFVMTLLLAGGCDNHPAQVQQPNARDRILTDANEIVSNPNAWSTNSRSFADFVRASVELHWEDMPEIKDLKASVLDLNVFATQWVQTLNSAQLKTFSNSLQDIAADVQAGDKTKIVPPAASANIHSDTTQQQLAELFANTTGQLTKEQAEQYAGLYRKLIESYERFYRFVINKTS